MTALTPLPAVPDQPLNSQSLVSKVIRNPLACCALAVLAVLFVVAVIGPWIAPAPANRVELGLTNAPPFSHGHLLGGDKVGRDILSRLIIGARGAAESAAILTAVAAALGVSCGLIAGYFGRVFDNVASWLFAVFMAAPGIVILVALYTVVGASPNVAMAALGVLSSSAFFWPVRTLTRAVRTELYVDAAKVSGLPTWRIVGRHVLIAVSGPVIVLASFLAGAAIGVQAALQFLGLGDPLTPSWGGMLSDAFSNIYVAPIQMLWPGLTIGLITAAFVLLGTAVRDAMQGASVRIGQRSRQRQIKALQSSESAEPLPAAATAQAGAPLLRISALRIAYPGRDAARMVVDNVSLDVDEGEVVGLVGESGAGKSQTVLAAAGLLDDDAIVAGGSITLAGVELLGASQKTLARYRGSAIGYIPQEPVSSLDPSFTIGSQLVYGIRAQRKITSRQARDLALAMLDRVGIADPDRVFRAYPHQVSGGMAQRALIAGAVACEPRLLLADEPTTALDVTTQADILELLRSLQSERQMGMLVVTHNFGVIADLCDRVLVMRDGTVVEQGTVRQVFDDPQHEYTRTLLDAVLDDAKPRSVAVELEVTDVR